MHSVNTRAKIRFMRFLLEVSVKLLVIFTSDNYDLMVTLFSWIWFASNWGHMHDIKLKKNAKRNWLRHSIMIVYSLCIMLVIWNVHNYLSSSVRIHTMAPCSTSLLRRSVISTFWTSSE